MNISFEIKMEDMYRYEISDREHILGMISDGGELRPSLLLGGSYLRVDDKEYGLEWTFIPNRVLKEIATHVVG